MVEAGYFSPLMIYTFTLGLHVNATTMCLTVRRPPSLPLCMSPTSSPVIVEPGQELCGVPVAGVPIPVTIRPDEVRLVASDQVIQLRHHHLLQMRDIDSWDHKTCQEKLWHFYSFFLECNNAIYFWHRLWKLNSWATKYVKKNTLVYTYRVSRNTIIQYISGSVATQILHSRVLGSHSKANL